jgi:tetratricopeptide (TPR) repeat protein
MCYNQNMQIKHPVLGGAILLTSIVLLFPQLGGGEELPDDVRFFDSNEELDALDEDLGGSQDTIIELYLEVASYFYNTGKFGDAIATYASAISRDEDCAPAWYGLARCYAQTSEFAKAIAALEKAIFLHPQYQTQAGSDTAFDELKTLPRFKAVVGEGE